jgi:hypothetical protein
MRTNRDGRTDMTKLTVVFAILRTCQEIAIISRKGNHGDITIVCGCDEMSQHILDYGAVEVLPVPLSV